ncbi:hypothetical protein SELMODRAFT_413687 [Selaginella moellendorffii]|uniref:Uncharacterized protein n=1 Tax=Selaginella moellendorffii TaxID=88036 RepID=D8RPW6_SELML|nr:hypothetical protein SELMODRAFT_413687 [Selaginella moellendorffii]
MMVMLFLSFSLSKGQHAQYLRWTISMNLSYSAHQQPRPAGGVYKFTDKERTKMLLVDQDELQNYYSVPEFPKLANPSRDQEISIGNSITAWHLIILRESDLEEKALALASKPDLTSQEQDHNESSTQPLLALSSYTDDQGRRDLRLYVGFGYRIAPLLQSCPACLLRRQSWLTLKLYMLPEKKKVSSTQSYCIQGHKHSLAKEISRAPSLS